MNDIVIPLRVSNVGTVQRQLAAVGRSVATLNNGAVVAGGRSNGSAQRLPWQFNRSARSQRTPPTLSQQLQNAVSSSRFSMSNGRMSVSPLIGRTMAVFGRFNPVVTAATLVLGGFTTAAQNAAQVLSTFRSAQITSGGTAQQTAQLGAMGGSIGMSAQDMANLSREFANKISSDGVAAGFGSRAGIRDVGEVFGNQNKAENLLKWAKYLRMLSEVEATRAARATGTEALLPLRDVSDKTLRQMEADAKVRESLSDPAMTKQAAEFNAQLSRLKGNFETAKMAFGQPLIELGSWFMEKIANGLQKGSDPRTGSAFEPFAPPKPKSEVKENTEATKQLNDTLKQYLKSGTYGGGERARGAMPKAWTGQSADQWANAIGGLGPFNS